MTQKLFSKNFTLLVAGQVSSLFGNLILRLALSMYVLEKTGSAAVFGGILAVATIPSIALSPLGGILADRANRRNIMVALDALTGLSVLAAALLLSASSDIVVIAVLLVLLSVLGAFETPTVQACVPQMQSGDNIIKGNAVVNQLAAVSSLVAPVVGSVLYVAFGLRPVMLTSIVCFFLTAAFECFIKLEYVPFDSSEGVWAIIRNDFSVSMRFICKEQPGILKMLFLIAFIGFFAISISVIGLPYIVRTVLGLSARHYGIAQSTLGISAIVGGIAVGFLVGKLKTHSLSLVLAALGVLLLPAGMVFLFPVSTLTRYIITTLAFCSVHVAVTVFSVFAVSLIQQRTPNHLIGKIMAYTSAITLSTQPLGQIMYGLLFDRFSSAVYLVLIPTGIAVCIIGLLSTGFFKKLEAGQSITH